MSGLTLTVLAAGMGSRYGGLKQLDPVGPGGEVILDYSLFDARRAGFDRAVFVIRRDIESAFRERFESRVPAGMVVDYAFQSATDLPAGYAAPAGRDKPWGTGHAVWSARHVVRSPFAVVNADDFYGAGAFQSLAGFLRSGSRSSFAEIPAARYAMVGYRLANTLSEFGLVSRGLCQLGPDARLRGIVEQKGIPARDVGPGRPFSGDETVSMNCWGFTTALFPALEKGFRVFLDANLKDPAAEFYLPAAVSTMIGRGSATVEVLPTADSWFGVTYREDRPRVQSALAALIAAGSYPSPLK